MSSHISQAEIDAATADINAAIGANQDRNQENTNAYLGGVKPGQEYYPGQATSVAGSRYGYGSRALPISPDGTEPITADDTRTLFISGDGARQVGRWSPERLSKYEQMMVNAGILQPGSFTPGQVGRGQINAWEYVLGEANYFGKPPITMLSDLQKQGLNRPRGGSRGGGGGRSTVTTIPDYKTIAQNAKDMLTETMGRKMEDWEVTLAADELQRNYKKNVSQQLQASLAGSGQFEITEPRAATQSFIEDKYANELSRLSDVGQRGVNYKLAMDVFTQGGSRVAQ